MFTINEAWKIDTGSNLYIDGMRYLKAQLFPENIFGPIRLLKIKIVLFNDGKMSESLSKHYITSVKSIPCRV